MAFDFQHFLTQHGIEFVTEGRNVSADNIAIKCPFCGHADPSQHMNISTEGKGWFCFRDRTHSGRNPVRLVVALIGCSVSQAMAICGVQDRIPDDYMERMRALLSPIAITKDTRTLAMPDAFRVFSNLPAARPFITYLTHRGYDRGDILDLAQRYDLRYCLRGAFGQRIIFPVTMNGRLVTWTGRTISRITTLRYKTLTTNAEKAHLEGVPIALSQITDTLLFHDKLQKGGEVIVLCEGPFDALRVSWLGINYGVHATCFFTQHASSTQIDLLHQLLPRFKRRIILLDEGTITAGSQLYDLLVSLRVEYKYLQPNVKDPALLQEQNFFANVLG